MKWNRRVHVWSIVHTLAIVWLLCLCSPSSVLALAPSSTTLTLSNPNAQVGEPVWLNAAVSQSGSPVTVGTVTFRAGTRVLGTATVAGFRPGQNHATGAAILWTKFAPGSYSITAHYNGTAAIPASNSASKPLNVSGMESSVTALVATPNGFNFDIGVSVTGSGFGAPTGTVSVTDRTTSASLGTANLSAARQSLRPQAGYSTDTAPQSVATGDLNEDGIPDVVTANSGTNNISILLGDPNALGNLTRQFKQTVGRGPSAIAIADLNGDGVLDIVVANSTDGTISVILGSPVYPGAEFAAQVVYAVGTAPSAVVVGDVNADGIPDLVVANKGDNTVTVMLGDAGNPGGFLPAVSYPTGSAPTSVALGDWTGDGVVDIAVANSGESTVSILPGDAGHPGQFLNQMSVAVSAAATFLGAADLNNDGRPDLAIAFAASGTVGVLLADPAHPGQFLSQQTYSVGAQPSSLAVGDLDGDGLPDLIVTNRGDKTVSTLLGDKTHPGQFLAQRNYGTDAQPSAVSLADFNGDGVPDIAVTNAGSNTVSVLLGGTMSQGILTNVPLSGNGPHTIQATYPTGALYTTSLGTTTATVTPVATATTLSVSADGQPLPLSGFVGSMQALMLTASIVPGTANGLTASGSLTFLDGATAIASCPTTFTINASGNGSATCWPSLSIGSHTLTAHFTATAGGHFAGSTSAAVRPNVVVLAASNLVLTGPSVALAGQAANYFVRVTDQLNAVVTGFVGTVHFASSDATATLPPDYTFTPADAGGLAFPITFGSGGAQMVTVSIPGGAQISATLPVSVGVNSATMLKVTPPNASLGQPIKLTANVTAGGSAVATGMVTFLDGLRVLGVGELVGLAPASGFTPGFAQLTVRLGSGSHSITAKFGSLHGVVGSTSGAQTVVVAGTEPTGTALTSSPNGANYDLTGTVSGFGPIAPAGTVNFVDVTSASITLGTAAAVASSAQPSYVAHAYRAGGVLTSVTVGDLNGDGIPDIAAVDQANNRIVVLLGDPANPGQFLTAATYAAGSNPGSLAIADLNADGAPDLLVANSNDGTLSVFLGNSDGTFQAQRTYVAGNHPVSIVVGDWNGDGVPDVAIASSGDRSVGVLLGNGDGTVQTRQSFTVATNPTAIVSADLNGDGVPDLVVTNSGDSNVNVLMARGDGTFLPAVAFSVGIYPVAIVAGDFNRDGLVDLAVASRDSRSISLLLGKGDGGFFVGSPIALVHTPVALAVGDANSDGSPDLVIANSDDASFTTLRGNGNGTFLPAADTALTFLPGSMTLGDWNSDGLQDVLMASSTGPDLSLQLGASTIPVQLTNVPLLGIGLHSVQASYTPASGVVALASDSNLLSLAGGLGAQTINFGAIAPVTYGSAAITLNATSTSGLAVTFRVSSGPGSILGNALIITGAGQIVIEADQAGDTSSYAAAQPVNQSLTVNPATLTATPAPDARTFGSTNPVFTGTLTGVVTADNITATYSSASDALTVPSVYASGANAIHASLVDPGARLSNYTQVLNLGTLTITNAPQTITFDPMQAVTYGGPAVVLTARLSSLLPALYTVVSGPGRISGNTLVLTGAGTIVVQADQPGNGSYLPALPVRQTIAVNAAQLNVTAKAAARSFGAPNPTFSGTMTGVVTSDGITATYSSGATATTPMGVYASGANAISATLVDPNNRLSNYTATQTPGALTITQASQTITFPPLGAATYGAGPMSLTATSSSALPVTFQVVSGPAILSGSTLTLNGAGVVVVEANQAGNATFPPAVPVQETLIANKAQLTVIPNAAARSVGMANPIFTGMLTGVVVGDNITATYSSTANATTPVGVYAMASNGITSTLSDQAGRLSNYVVTQDVGTLTITQPTQTINFGPLSPVGYSAVPITLNATTTAGLKVKYQIVSGPATVSGSNVTCTGAGVVVIEADQGGNVSVPAAAPVLQSLTVNRAPLTITPSPASRAYGTANPNLSGTLSGVVNADALSATYATAASAGSPVGIYSITATLSDSLNKAANYDVTVKTATLTVTKAILAVTANDVARAYGLPNPPLAGKILGAFSDDPITASYFTSAVTASSPAVYAIAVQATGVDPANYNVVITPGSLTVTPANATVNLTLSTLATATGTSVTLTAGVASATSGEPSGTITFFDGQTTLGVFHPDLKGQAALSSTTFAAGRHTITAAYNGDANFAPAASLSATLVIGTPDFGITSESPSLTIGAGQSSSVRLIATPAFGFNQPLTFTCGTLPKYLSCQFSPSAVSLDGVQAAPVQLTVSVASTTSSLRGSPSALLAAVLPLGLLSLMPLSRGRRRWRRLPGLLLLCLCISGAMLACGGGGGSAPASTIPPPATPTAPSGTQTVTVTVTSGGISHSVPLSIVIKGS